MRTVLTVILLVCFCFALKSATLTEYNACSFERNEVYFSYANVLQTDSLKKNAERELKKKETFLAGVISALKIKKNLRAKEALRIEAIVRKYFIQDSISLLALTQTLSKFTNVVRFDSLVKELNKRKVSPEQLKLQIDSMINNPALPCKDCKEEITDKQIQELAEKLAPVVAEKAKEEESKEQKQKKIRLIKQILSTTIPIIDTLEINDTLSKRYRLTLRKQEVYGYHPSWMNKRYYNYNFSLLSTLAYYGYELNGKTGLAVTNHGWDTAAVITKAKKEGVKVHLVVYCPSKQDLQAFLKNTKAQEEFSASVIQLLRARNADGVNLMFESVGKDSRNRITRFVRSFSRELKAADLKYALILSLPNVDENDDYDVEALQESVDYFIIDFSKKSSYGPICPLTGSDYSLDAGISRYLAKKVPAAKYIACLPYRGANWDYQSKEFIEYVPYDRVVKSYLPDFGKFYDKNGNVRTDVVVDGDTLEQLWYDDDKTLSAKYDLILGNKLSGVGLWTLGDDDKHPELWDALLDKMIEFDTTDVVMIYKPKPKNVNRTFWQSVMYELSLYKELFQHPCHFDDTDDKRKELKSDDLIGFVAGGFAILLVITSTYSIMKRKSLGDDWDKRKMFLIIQIVLVVLVMTSLLMFCFLNPAFYHFGARKGSPGDCETSFATILEVLAIGFVIGLLAMKFLVMPLFKPKEIP